MKAILAAALLLLPSCGSAAIKIVSTQASSVVAGSVGTSALTADSVTRTAIINAAVDSSKLATGAVDTGRLGTDAVTASAILNATITGVKIAASAIDTTKLAADSVTAAVIMNGTIGSAALATGAVDTNRLGTDAVNSAAILNGAVTKTKIGSAAIDSSKIANGAIDTNRLGVDAVTASAILNGTITGNKFAAGAVPSLSAANTWTGIQSFNVTTSTQARAFGYSAYSGASNANGRFSLGSTAGFEAFLDLDAANGILRIGNAQNAAGDQILFPIKTAGTASTLLGLIGSSISPIGNSAGSGGLSIVDGGSLYMGGNSVATSSMSVVGGIVSVPSQPAVELSGGSPTNITAASQQDIYWSIDRQTQGMIASSSSNTVHIPVGGDGVYSIDYNFFCNNSVGGAWQIYLYVNGTQVNGGYDTDFALSTDAYARAGIHVKRNMAAGDAITAKVFNPTGVAQNCFVNSTTVPTLFIYKQ